MTEYTLRTIEFTIMGSDEGLEEVSELSTYQMSRVSRSIKRKSRRFTLANVHLNQR